MNELLRMYVCMHVCMLTTLSRLQRILACRNCASLNGICSIKLRVWVPLWTQNSFEVWNVVLDSKSLHMDQIIVNKVISVASSNSIDKTTR